MGKQAYTRLRRQKHAIERIADRHYAIVLLRKVWSDWRLRASEWMSRRLAHGLAQSFFQASVCKRAITSWKRWVPMHIDACTVLPRAVEHTHRPATPVLWTCSCATPALVAGFSAPCMIGVRVCLKPSLCFMFPSVIVPPVQVGR